MRSSQRRAVVAAIMHIALIWALAACVLLHEVVPVVVAALALTILAGITWRWTVRVIDRSEAAQRIASERQVLSAVIEASSALAAVLDNQGRVVHSNQRFRDLLGYEADPAGALVQPGLKGADGLLGFAAGGRPGTVEADLELQRPHDRLLLHFSASRQALPVSGDCVVMIGHDETLRHRARESLAQTAKLAALGELTSGIAHELSQPMNVIRMAAQNALAEAIPENGGTEAGDESDAFGMVPMSDSEFRSLAVAKLQRIVDQVDRAALILSRMRIFSRSSQTGPKEFDVRDACEGALTLVAARFRRAGVAVNKDLGAAPVQALGHESLLQQVIVNLLVNACDALADSPTQPRHVTVTLAWRPQNRIAIQVGDNGPGVPPDIRQRIFEPFFTTKPAGRNAGLGLSFAYGVMQDLGGELKLLPDEPGAVFAIDLPASEKME